MAHLSKKVVTSGIACNTISRKWGPTSVSQPYKPFDSSTSASVSLRSVEPSSKSPFEDQLSNLIDTVRNSRVERSETLLLLSVAMDWKFHQQKQPVRRTLLGVIVTEQKRMVTSPKTFTLYQDPYSIKLETDENLQTGTFKKRQTYHATLQPASGQIAVM